MNFEVVHAIECLDELIREGRLEPTKKMPLRVTYHDPCHLGRLSETKIPSEGKEERILGCLPVKDIPKAIGMNGIFDPPRNVIKSIPGVELLEMERSREYSWCCGSGGGVKSAFPDFALWSAGERLEEAKATGAEALVTCCPWCEKNLKDAVDSHGETFPVYDATDLLIQSL
jgi:Fe-S oxidoreductase